MFSYVILHNKELWLVKHIISQKRLWTCLLHVYLLEQIWQIQMTGSNICRF